MIWHRYLSSVFLVSVLRRRDSFAISDGVSARLCVSLHNVSACVHENVYPLCGHVCVLYVRVC